MDMDDFMGRSGVDPGEHHEPAFPVGVTTTVVGDATVFEVEYSDGTRVVVSREQAFYAAVAIHARGLAAMPQPAPDAAVAPPGVSPKMIRNPNAKPPAFLGAVSSPSMPQPAPDVAVAHRINHGPESRNPERPADSGRDDLAAHGAAPADSPHDARAVAGADAPRRNNAAPAAAGAGALATFINRTFDAGGAIGRNALRGAGVAAAKISPLAGAAAVAAYRSAKNLISSGGFVAPGDPYERNEPTIEPRMPERTQMAPAAQDVADTSGQRPMMAAFFRSVAEFEQSVADLYRSATGRDERSLDVPLDPPANDDFHLEGVVKLKPRTEPVRPGAGTGYGARQPTFAEALAGMPHAHEHIERCDDCLTRVGDRADMAIREMAGYDDSDAAREIQKKAMQDAIERANQRVRALFGGMDDHPLAERSKAQSAMIGKLISILSSMAKA